MRPEINAQTYSILEALPAACFVGTWDHDAVADRVILDAGAAEALTGDRELSGKPITLQHTFLRLHPRDGGWVIPKIDAVAEKGGELIADYRIQSSAGVRLLLDRGTIIRHADGRVHGYGILLDITDVNYDEIFGNIQKTKHLVAKPRSIFDDLREEVERRGSFRSQVLLDMLRTELNRPQSR